MRGSSLIEPDADLKAIATLRCLTAPRLANAIGLALQHHDPVSRTAYIAKLRLQLDDLEIEQQSQSEFLIAENFTQIVAEADTQAEQILLAAFLKSKGNTKNRFKSRDLTELLKANSNIDAPKNIGNAIKKLLSEKYFETIDTIEVNFPSDETEDRTKQHQIFHLTEAGYEEANELIQKIILSIRSK